MSIIDLLVVLARRWYVLVPVLAVGVVASSSYSERISPLHRASTSVVLLNPSLQQVGQGEALVPNNPLLQIGGSLIPLANALALQVSASSQRAAVEAAGGSGAWEITPSTQTPFLVVTAEAPTPDAALQTVRSVTTILQALLEESQARYKVPAPLRVTVEPLVPPELSGLNTQGKTRVRLVILAIALALAACLAVFVDVLARRRNRRKLLAIESRPSERSVAQ